jgi:iron complex transport system substrate-binding protein
MSCSSELKTPVYQSSAGRLRCIAYLTVSRILLFFGFLIFVCALVFSYRGGSPCMNGVRVEVLAVTPDYRLIRHSLGQTKVPIAPQRIVSLGGAFTESLLAMNITPVAVEGSWAAGEAGKPFAHIAKRLADAEVVSGNGTINLEAIAKVKPDLILVAGSENSIWYRYLCEIAPTVAIVVNGMPPNRERDALLNVGDILGRKKKAEQVLEKYDAKIAAARTVLADAIGHKPVLYLMLSGRRCMSRPLLFQTLLCNHLGLIQDPTVLNRSEPVTWDVLSVERMSRLKAEYIFVGMDRRTEGFWKEVVESPYNKNIPAFQQGHVFPVKHSTWCGQGILACEIMIDEILAAATKERSR